ncbi:MAG: hypothetical protein JXX28_19115 [Deltaproteobacteria bacterium]|nr:hypothetical protein [Deltaproteobacteria bacterium]
MPFVLLSFALLGSAWAQAPVPARHVPSSVMGELRLLENRFEIALAADCDPGRCVAQGCAYLDHQVADQPRSASLPGLGQDPGPGSAPEQAYLTQASCSFAYEDSVKAADAAALARRLGLKLSKAWTVVSVEPQQLEPLPRYLQEPAPPEPAPEPPPVEAEEEAPPPPEAWSAGRELWASLLPHFFWMIGVLLVTFAATLLIWAWRRVGRASVEEQLLLAELAAGDQAEPPTAPPSDEEDGDERFVAREDAAWAARMSALDPSAPDPELVALTGDLLRAGELPLLAKAVLRFPDTLPAAFPTDGAVAAAKLELSEYLQGVDLEALPSDADFFRALNQRALAASLASQADAQVVRSLREDFGAAGLVALIGALPPRAAALLFAMAPPDEQQELVRLLQPQQVLSLSEALLSSNRMDRAERIHLFEVVGAARAGTALPPAPAAGEVTDRGVAFDAAGALSLLLEVVPTAARAALFAQTLRRFRGSLPAWQRGILVSEMLLSLSGEERADLFLEVEVEALAGWLSLRDPDLRAQLLAGTPDALRLSVQASSAFSSRARQLSLARTGRSLLSAGFQAQLSRARRSFESVVAGEA